MENAKGGILLKCLIGRKNTIIDNRMVEKESPIVYFFCFRVIKNDIFTVTKKIAYDPYFIISGLFQFLLHRARAK
jgi:uncharacterized protein (DUF427 family)